MAKLETKTALAALIGHPVSHSLSPFLFASLAKRLKKPVVYTRLDVTPAQVLSFFHDTKDQSIFTGWNITIPHKETLFRKVTKISSEAKAVGAINVIHFKRNHTVGYNTDVIGILATFREQHLDLRTKSVLLLGAGGAAKAAAFALGKSKAKVVWINNRTPKPANAICRHFSKQFPKTLFKVAKDVTKIPDSIGCVINATPLGLKGFRGTFLFPPHLTPDALAFDMILSPVQHRLSKKIAKACP